MTQAEYNAALSGLSRALGLGDEADTARLTDVLCAAEESILRYLNREELPGCARSLLIELAALKYLRTELELAPYDRLDIGGRLWEVRAIQRWPSHRKLMLQRVR